MLDKNHITSVPIRLDNQIYLEALLGTRGRGYGYVIVRFNSQSAHEKVSVNENLIQYD